MAFVDAVKATIKRKIDSFFLESRLLYFEVMDIILEFFAIFLHSESLLNPKHMKTDLIVNFAEPFIVILQY
jgi:hypothetical protein